MRSGHDVTALNKSLSICITALVSLSPFAFVPLTNASFLAEIWSALASGIAALAIGFFAVKTDHPSIPVPKCRLVPRAITVGILRFEGTLVTVLATVAVVFIVIAATRLGVIALALGNVFAGHG